MTDTKRSLIADPDKDTFWAAYTQALADLQTIQNDASVTNAEAVAYIKKLAAIQEKLLKFLKRQING